MATLNYTHEGESKTYDLPQSICSVEIAKHLHGPLILFSVLNTLLSTTAFLGNALILVALHKESSLHAPSKLLLRTLAITDLCVGIILEPLFVTAWVSMITKRWNICLYVIDAGFLISYTLGSVSMMTISTISVDRLLALSLRLKYKQIVTLKRTYAVVIAIWLTGIGGTAISLWNYFLTLWIGYIGVFVCLIVSCFSYIRIFLTLRQNQMLIRPYDHQSQPSEGKLLNIARYRKTVHNTLWVQVTLGICYLPYTVMGAIVAHGEINPFIYVAWTSAGTLVFLNSTLNPILYCWKIREVNQAVRGILRKISRPAI